MKNTTKNDKKEKLCEKERKNYEKQTISDKKQQNGSKNMSSDKVTASTDDCNKTPTFTLPLPPAIQAEKNSIGILQKKVVKSEKKQLFRWEKPHKKVVLIQTALPKFVCKKVWGSVRLRKFTANYK